MRLDKFLADAGYGTRSQVKELIRKGRVVLDGEVVRRPESVVPINGSRLECVIQVDGTEVSYSRYVYYMLYKPSGVVSATRDDREQTVLDLIEHYEKGLAPVGRLDKDTLGLLLLTNDGGLAHTLTSPRHHVDKVYVVHVDRELTPDLPEKFLAGIWIHDRSRQEELVQCRPAQMRIMEDPLEAVVTISEGKYHQIKRMFAACGYQVMGLKRIAMGTLVLDPKLEPGQYRPLTDREIQGLYDAKKRQRP